MEKISNKFIVFVTVLAGIALTGCGDNRSQVRSSDINSSGNYQKPWIYELSQGAAMVENNFVYIPGGFDVDGDTKNEDGFWLAKYEAKITDEDANISAVDNVRLFIEENFKAYNEKTEQFDQNLSGDYLATPASDIAGLEVKKAKFSEFGTTYSGVSPLEALISLKDSQIEDGYLIELPSEKQWMQIVQLVINNSKNWSENEVGQGRLYQGNDGVRDFVIANNLLGIDENVPKNYERNVTDLAGSVAEWTSGAVAINDRFTGDDLLEAEYNAVDQAPLWWKPILENESLSLTSLSGAGKYHNGSSLDGTNDTLEVSSYGTGDVDPYAIIARGGSNSIDDQDLVGISAAKLSYGVGYKGPTVGFRAASGYVQGVVE